MSINVIAHDTRLEGRTPLSTGGSVNFDVNGETPISDFFDRVLSISDEHGGVQTLYIMAHGVEVTAADTHAIQFCREFISYQTVDQFERLRDKVERIVLFVCAAAETTLSTHGDGDELCRQIAFLAHVEVTAAREVQAYNVTEHCGLFSCEEAALEFGEWEGTVVVYDASGNLISGFHNPSIWRDADGAVHDPRSDPDPRISTEHSRIEAGRRRRVSGERYSRHSSRI